MKKYLVEISVDVEVIARDEEDAIEKAVAEIQPGHCVVSDYED